MAEDDLAARLAAPEEDVQIYALCRAAARRIAALEAERAELRQALGDVVAVAVPDPDLPDVYMCVDRGAHFAALMVLDVDDIEGAEARRGTA